MPVATVHKSEIRRNATTTLRKTVPDVKHKICSIYPKEFIFSIHKNPVLPACDEDSPPDQTGYVDGIRYTFVEVGPGRSVKDESVDTGTQFLERYVVTEDIPAKIVALDCMGYSIDENHNVKDTDAARVFRGRGIFVPEGETPTKDELVAAEKAWRVAASIIYDIAQGKWAQHRKTNDIDDHQRIAARLLKKAPEWLGGQEANTDAPKPKSEIEQLTELVKTLLSNQAQGSVPAGSAAAPVTKGK